MIRRLATVGAAMGVVLAASCEVQTDLVLRANGRDAGGRGLDAATLDATSPDVRAPDPPPDAAPPITDAARDAVSDAPSPSDAAVEGGATPEAGGGCDDDDDCPFYDPRCDPVSRACVDCVDDDDCTDDDEPVCRDSECTER